MEQKHLKKEINLVGALSTVMGTVIGAGVFSKWPVSSIIRKMPRLLYLPGLWLVY